MLLDEITIRDIRNTVLPTPCFGLRLRSVQELEIRNCRFLNNYYNVYHHLMDLQFIKLTNLLIVNMMVLYE